jgi:signal transduction protein with GAF and PtsI domain
LQRNYDQIYQDLRKANEKYLNQKVDNNKLKDEVQILQNALEDAQTQIRRLQNSGAANLSSENRKIQPKTRINRHDPL